jgi:tetratricopeptide (TPR) repeat protein
MVVRPRQQEELAQAIIQLLEDAPQRESMGRAARQRALTYFTVDRALSLYLESYRRLAGQAATFALPLRQHLFTDRGFALMDAARYEDAIAQFRLAINEGTHSPAVPVLFLEIAKAYNEIGMFDQAFHELAKAEALIEIMEGIPA